MVSVGAGSVIASAAAAFFSFAAYRATEMRDAFEIEERVMRRHAEVGTTDGRLFVNLRRAAVREPDSQLYEFKRLFFLTPMRGTTELYFDVEDRGEEEDLSREDMRFDPEVLAELLQCELIDYSVEEGFNGEIRLSLVLDTVSPGMIDNIVRHLPWHLSERDKKSPVTKRVDEEVNIRQPEKSAV